MLEHDDSYKTSNVESGTITCAALGCDMKVRYSIEHPTRPRYCKKHAKELEARGRGSDTHIKNPPMTRRSIQEVVDGDA